MRRFEISESLFMFHILSLLPLLFILYFSFFGGGSRCGEAKMLRQLKRSKRKIIRYDLLAAISILEYTRNATREPHTLPPFYSSRYKYELHKKAYLKSPPAKGTSVKESPATQEDSATGGSFALPALQLFHRSRVAQQRILHPEAILWLHLLHGFIAVFLMEVQIFYSSCVMNILAHLFSITGVVHSIIESLQVLVITIQE